MIKAYDTNVTYYVAWNQELICLTYLFAMAIPLAIIAADMRIAAATMSAIIIPVSNGAL